MNIIKCKSQKINIYVKKHNCKILTIKLEKKKHNIPMKYGAFKDRVFISFCKSFWTFLYYKKIH